MMNLNINIATEDALSEAVAERLINEYTNFKINLKLGLKGNSHLKKNLKSYYQIAKRQPFLLITDLDSMSCATLLVSDWKQRLKITEPTQMIFRVAVREVEAWLLADREGLGSLLGTSNLPRNPDALDDPKRELLRFAQKASKNIRDGLVIKKGEIASQGLEYNSILSNFVKNSWNPERAIVYSDSLNRCKTRLQGINI